MGHVHRAQSINTRPNPSLRLGFSTWYRVRVFLLFPPPTQPLPPPHSSAAGPPLHGPPAWRGRCRRSSPRSGALARRVRCRHPTPTPRRGAPTPQHHRRPRPGPPIHQRRRRCVRHPRRDPVAPSPSLAGSPPYDIAWDKVTAPKENGDLGVVNLKLQNQALLMKH
jgi:hypothetical protein